ncbi:hypothetical protein M5G27_25975 [Pseudomonas shahriarae]|uniref:Uncharacterized protein n=1 Tax=Pseudomonas shahriarae TaxID=2745512 RepID=A0A9X4C6P3_9PSED|nr:hypothetical protein [Pseudomonas shahriarae]MDD1010926.1 hypothetical protein [Pseudomonas shahriarae]
MDLTRGLCHEEFIAAITHLEEMVSHPSAAGVCRQILAVGLESLSPAQLAVYEGYIWPNLLERCATCPKMVPAGVGYCPVCAIEYDN